MPSIITSRNSLPSRFLFSYKSRRFVFYRKRCSFLPRWTYFTVSHTDIGLSVFAGLKSGRRAPCRKLTLYRRPMCWSISAPWPFADVLQCLRSVVTPRKYYLGFYYISGFFSSFSDQQMSQQQPGSGMGGGGGKEMRRSLLGSAGSDAVGMGDMNQGYGIVGLR